MIERNHRQARSRRPAAIGVMRAYEAHLLGRCQLQLKEGVELPGRVAVDVAGFIERLDVPIRQEM